MSTSCFTSYIYIKRSVSLFYIILNIVYLLISEVGEASPATGSTRGTLPVPIEISSISETSSDCFILNAAFSPGTLTELPAETSLDIPHRLFKGHKHVELIGACKSACTVQEGCAFWQAEFVLKECRLFGFQHVNDSLVQRKDGFAVGSYECERYNIRTQKHLGLGLDVMPHSASNATSAILAFDEDACADFAVSQSLDFWLFDPYDRKCTVINTTALPHSQHSFSPSNDKKVLGLGQADWGAFVPDMQVADVIVEVVAGSAHACMRICAYMQHCQSWSIDLLANKCKLGKSLTLVPGERTVAGTLKDDLGQAGCLWEDIDMDSGNVGVIKDCESAVECRRHCLKDRRCDYFTYDQNKKACYLKDDRAMYRVVMRNGMVSGSLCPTKPENAGTMMSGMGLPKVGETCLTVGWERDGNAVSLVLTMDTYSNCRDLCNSPYWKAKCKSWSFDNLNKKCSLFRNDPKQWRKSFYAVSGAGTCANTKRGQTKHRTAREHLKLKQ